MKMKMKKESKYVRVPTWMMIVFLIFYYLRQRYLVTTDNYDIIICLASFIVTVIYYFCMLFVIKKKKSMLHCFIVLFWLVVGGWICLYSYGLCIKDNAESIACTLQLEGYYTRRGSSVFFTFKDWRFEKKFSLRNMKDKNINEHPEKYDVHLRLLNVLPEIYYIDRMYIKENNYKK